MSVEDQLRAMATAAGLDYDKCIEEDWTLVQFSMAVNGFDLCSRCDGGGAIRVDNGSMVAPPEEEPCPQCNGEGMLKRRWVER